MYLLLDVSCTCCKKLPKNPNYVSFHCRDTSEHNRAKKLYNQASAVHKLLMANDSTRVEVGFQSIKGEKEMFNELKRHFGYNPDVSAQIDCLAKLPDARILMSTWHFALQMHVLTHSIVDVWIGSDDKMLRVSACIHFVKNHQLIDILTLFGYVLKPRYKPCTFNHFHFQSILRRPKIVSRMIFK